MQDKFIILGAGGHGVVIAEIIEAMGAKVIAFLDRASFPGGMIGYPVYASSLEIPNHLIHHEDKYIIGVGNNATRKKLAADFSVSWGQALHPSAVISPRALIGPGSVAMAGAVVNACTQIGNHCIINTGCSIDHDCTIEDFVHISPGAHLAGNICVGEGAHIGIGASVIQEIKIVKWATVGAGAVVISDVPDGATVAGVPARVI